MDGALKALECPRNARPGKPGQDCVRSPAPAASYRITLEIALSLNAGTIAELRTALETARFALGEVLEQGARSCDEELKSTCDLIDRVLQRHPGARP